jgi:hypothetical protein
MLNREVVCLITQFPEQVALLRLLYLLHNRPFHRQTFRTQTLQTAMSVVHTVDRSVMLSKALCVLQVAAAAVANQWLQQHQLGTLYYESSIA